MYRIDFWRSEYLLIVRHADCNVTALTISHSGIASCLSSTDSTCLRQSRLLRHRFAVRLEACVTGDAGLGPGAYSSLIELDYLRCVKFGGFFASFGIMRG